MAHRKNQLDDTIATGLFRSQSNIQDGVFVLKT